MHRENTDSIVSLHCLEDVNSKFCGFMLVNYRMGEQHELPHCGRISSCKLARPL